MEKKFYTNDERLAHLKLCFSQGDLDTHDRAVKLAWEWIKTGKFTFHEFQKVLMAYESFKRCKSSVT